jgi:hypothetical protein
MPDLYISIVMRNREFKNVSHSDEWLWNVYDIAILYVELHSGPTMQ